MEFRPLFLPAGRTPYKIGSSFPGREARFTGFRFSTPQRTLTAAGARLERRLSEAQRRRFAAAFEAAGPTAAAGWRRIMALLGAHELAQGGRARTASTPRPRRVAARGGVPRG